MKKFSDFIVESQDINLAMKAQKTLSYEAKRALDQWESSGWIDGPLEKSIKANDEIAQEIESAFSPVREFLRKKHGNTILLYRGMKKSITGGKHDNRLLFSWTSDLKTAELFAGLRRGPKFKSLLADIPTQAEIDKAVSNYDRTGFTKFGSHRYIRNKEYPEYYNIFRGRENITDGDNLRRDLESERDDAVKYNKSITDNALLLKQKIKIDDIVWITNELDSKEYIVKNVGMR